jgi:hypothetical protein
MITAAWVLTAGLASFLAGLYVVHYSRDSISGWLNKVGR